MLNTKILIVLHYAGGSAYSMMGLKKNIDPNIKVFFIELPGRGKRIKEELITDVNLIIDDLFEKVDFLISESSEYYIFGHSMGALLGYLLVHRFIKENKKLPSHLFVSGTGGPSKERDEKLSLLSSKDFRLKLKEYGGSSDEVLNDDSLMDFFEPIIRSDFKVIESYSYVEQEKFNVPITGFYGSEEKTSLSDMKLWQKESSYQTKIFEFSGNHFFINENWEDISLIVNNVISRLEKDIKIT